MLLANSTVVLHVDELSLYTFREKKNMYKVSLINA